MKVARAMAAQRAAALSGRRDGGRQLQQGGVNPHISGFFGDRPSAPRFAMLKKSKKRELLARRGRRLLGGSERPYWRCALCVGVVGWFGLAERKAPDVDFFARLPVGSNSNKSPASGKICLASSRGSGLDQNRPWLGLRLGLVDLSRIPSGQPPT